MRSGFSNLAEPSQSGWSAEDWNVAQAALLVFTEDSMVMAKEYAALQGHPEATVNDIMDCLKAKTREGLASSPHFMERLTEYRTAIQSMDAEPEAMDAEPADAAEQLLHTMDGSLPPARPEQTALVQRVRQSVATWDAWSPQNDIEEILKHAVNNTAQAFNA